MSGLTAKATFRPHGYIGRFIPAVITPAVRISVESACALIEASAKGYAPVRTGALRESISTEIRETDKTIVGEVAPHVSYAQFLEFGTYKMAAQPFMRPAYEENRGAILDLFRGNIALAL